MPRTNKGKLSHRPAVYLYMTSRERAAQYVAIVKAFGEISGMVGRDYVTRSIGLQRLADHGVPEDMTLEYDSETLRAQVQELAQIEVD